MIWERISPFAFRPALDQPKVTPVISLKKDLTVLTVLDRVYGVDLARDTHAHIVFDNGRYTLWVGTENHPSQKGISSYKLTPYWFSEAVDALADDMSLWKQVRQEK